MKMVCVCNCVFRGDTVRKGAVVEMSGEEAKGFPAASSFVPFGGGDAEGPSAPPSGGAVLVAGLTREQAVLKLYQAGVSVPEKISAAKLRERFEETFGAGA